MESWERQTSLDDQQIRFSAPNCGEYFPIQSCNAFRTDLRKYHQFGLQEPMKCSDGHSSAYLHSSVFVSSQLCIEGVFSAQLLRRQSVSDRFAWIFEIWIVFFGLRFEKTAPRAQQKRITKFVVSYHDHACTDLVRIFCHSSEKKTGASANWSLIGDFPLFFSYRNSLYNLVFRLERKTSSEVIASSNKILWQAFNP